MIWLKLKFPTLGAMTEVAHHSGHRRMERQHGGLVRTCSSEALEPLDLRVLEDVCVVLDAKYVGQRPCVLLVH